MDSRNLIKEIISIFLWNAFLKLYFGMCPSYILEIQNALNNSPMKVCFCVKDHSLAPLKPRDGLAVRGIRRKVSIPKQDRGRKIGRTFRRH